MEIQIPKSMKQQQKSIEIVVSNDDLLSDILLGLSTEYLMRCKIVSKRWQSLITSSSFRRRWSLNRVPAAGLFLPGKNFQTNQLYEYIPFSAKTKTIAPFSKLDFTSDPHGIRIIHSCYGLLLCCSFWTTPYTPAKYYVYNPTTNEFANLPLLFRATKTIRGMCLAFDPKKSPHYKVACVRGLGRLVDCRYQIEIYSSETGTWTITGIGIAQPFAINIDFENGVYWNNAIHWKPYQYGGDFVYFDLQHHVLNKMPKPPVYVGSGDGAFPYFGESCGHLHYIQQLSCEQTQFNVYAMKSDYSEWFVKYRVDLSLVAAANNEMVRAVPGWTLFFFNVCCVVWDEEEDGSFLVVHIPGKVIRYNLLRKTFEDLHEFETAPGDAGFASLPRTNGFQYIESPCCV